MIVKHNSDENLM